MRTTERLSGIKSWAQKNLCEGREMKAPGRQGSITEVCIQEPQCYLAWAPTRPDMTDMRQMNPAGAYPAITIMPSRSYAKNPEEKRFDRYGNIRRSKDYSQTLCISILFSVYEPGVRLPGFMGSADSDGQGLNLNLLAEGTEQGLFTLLDWMDDCREALLRDRHIPGTDLSVDVATIAYQMYTDQSYIVDKRPFYYGFLEAEFDCYADSGVNHEIEGLLK